MNSKTQTGFVQVDRERRRFRVDRRTYSDTAILRRECETVSRLERHTHCLRSRALAAALELG